MSLYTLECSEELYLQPVDHDVEEPQYLLPNEEVVYKCVTERDCSAPYDEIQVEDENFCYGNMAPIYKYV